MIRQRGTPSGVQNPVPDITARIPRIDREGESYLLTAIVGNGPRT
jgi:hypothetical protein